MRADDLERLVDVDGGAAGRLGDLEPGAQRVPLLAVLGQVDRRRGRPEDRARPGSRSASFSGVWPPSDTMTPTSSPVACSASMTFLTSSKVSGSK